MRRTGLSVLFLVFTTVVLTSTGCKGFIQKSAMNTTASILTRAKVAAQQEDDYELAKVAIPASLKTVEGFHVANPANTDLQEILAEGWCQYATGVLTEQWEVAKWKGQFDEAEELRRRGTNLYLRCINYSLMLLPEEWSTALYGDIDGLQALADKAGEEELFAMTWIGLGLASIVNLNRDDIVLVANLPKAELLLKRVVEIDQNFKFGLPLMGLATMNSSRGKALGGEPEMGKKMFEDASAVTGGKMLLVKVMMARNYAVITQNRELFRKTLVEVLQTDPAVFPEQRLANEIAHIKARRYLKRENDWF